MSGMSAPQRIVSLLPSATELLFAIGAGDQVVAVTHECDHPAACRGLPVVTRNLIDHGGNAPATIGPPHHRRAPSGIKHLRAR